MALLTVGRLPAHVAVDSTGDLHLRTVYLVVLNSPVKPTVAGVSIFELALVAMIVVL